MAKARRVRSKRLVLDIGTSAVRVCELTPTKQGYQLTKYYHREFPIDPSMEEEAQREVRKNVVQALLKEAKIRTKKTVFGVPGQSVFTRTRTLPPVPDYKVTQIVRYEIQQQIPFQLDQIAYDFQVLQRTEAGGYDVLMAAIKVDVVEKRLEPIKDLKKRVEVVDVCPLAAYNWLKFTKEFGDTGECIALIDLGAATTDIVIERDNQFRFTRSLNLGGNDITSAIAADFNCEWAQAEKLKRERGFAPTGDPARDGKGGEVIGRVLNRLVSEINRSFAYFRSQPGGGPVSRIILTGGGACLRNIVPYLQRQLGIEVRIAQPLAGLAIGPGAQEVNEHPEQAAVVMGLALRCCEQVAININLIPPRLVEAARRRDQAVYWLLSVVTLILIMLTIVPAMAQQNKLIQDQITLQKNAIARYDPALPFKPGAPNTWRSQYENDYQAALAEIQGYEQKLALFDGKLKARRQWINDLVTISDARPKGKLILIHTLESTVIGPRGAQIGAGPQPANWSSSGFEGIQQGGASRLTGLVAQRAMMAGAQPADPRPYNGISIHGYAQDIGTLEEFVKNLKSSKRFIPDGVYFDERSAEPITYVDALMNPGGGRAAAAAATTTPSDDREDRRGGGRFDQLSQRQGAAQSNSALLQWDQPNTVVSFRIDLQYEGTKVEAPVPGQEVGADESVESRVERIRRRQERRGEAAD